MPATVLQTTAVLPVVLQPAWVQAFMPAVHIWTSAFHEAEDLGGIGIIRPDTGEMVWIDAAGGRPNG